jgi:cation transport ATPase
VFGGLGARAKWETVRSLGSGTIWVGDGGAAEAALARAAAAVSVSIARIDALPQDMADIVLLRGNLDSLLAARRAAERRLDRLRADYRVVYLANLAAVGGGFAAGFGSLQAGLVSNLGSAAVFLSRWRSLMGLAARAERIARARSGLLG